MLVRVNPCHHVLMILRAPYGVAVVGVEASWRDATSRGGACRYVRGSGLRLVSLPACAAFGDRTRNAAAFLVEGDAVVVEALAVSRG